MIDPNQATNSEYDMRCSFCCRKASKMVAAHGKGICNEREIEIARQTRAGIK